MDISRCGLFVLLFALSFIGLSGLLSDNASAWNNDYPIQYCDYPAFSAGHVQDIIQNPPFHTGIPEFTFDSWDSALTCIEENGQVYYYVHVAPTATGASYWNYVNHATRGDEYTLYISGGRSYFMFDDTGEFLGRTNNASAVNIPFVNKYSADQSGFVASNITDTSVAFDNANGEIPDSLTSSEPSNWTPDIKLHKGDNWTVELSDYNFYTFDKVAFTCGDDELAPIIIWDIFDITENEETPIFIDTLTFGAPAVVTYTAEKVQEDRRYRLIAKYAECEGITFDNSSIKDFTINKDGTLNKTDYMTVCLIDEFPWINVMDCYAEINDYLALLAFKVPDEKDIGGGGISTLATGCRELQVIDTWIFAQDQTVCPQMPNYVRNIVTPFIVFALALGTLTFISRKTGSG